MSVLSMSAACTSNGGPANVDPAQQAVNPLASGGEAPEETLPMPAPVSIAIPPLPRPSELAGKLNWRKQASYAEGDLVKAGESYEVMLPNHRVTAGAGVELDPAWNQPSDGVELLAYCMYSFNLPGYDRNAQVRYTWGTPPSPVGDVWIGLANWGPDCWNWYQCSPTGKSDLPSLAPYLAFGGGLLLCVVATGVDESTLSEVRIGTELPTAAFTPTAAKGFAPLSQTFYAAGSSDPDGSIARYEWDFDGNGIFETDAGANSTIEHTFPTPGPVQVKLRVTDDDGMMASTTGVVGVAAPFAHTWGVTGGEDLGRGIAADSAGNVYLVGYTMSATNGDEGVICKFDAAGQPVWSKLFTGPNTERFNGITAGTDGRLYVCGTTGSYGYTMYGGVNGLVQCWDPEGDLVWSKTWSGSEDDSFAGIALCSGDICVAGGSASFSLSMDALIAKFDADGALIWDKCFGAANYDTLNAIAVARVLLGDPVLYVTGKTAVTPITDTDLIYCRLSEDGAFLERSTFGNDTDAQVGYAICPAAALGARTIIVGTSSSGTSSRDMLLLCPAGAWARTWNGGMTDDALSVARRSDGNYLVGGYAQTVTQGWVDAVLLTLSPEGAGVGLSIRDSHGQQDSVAALCNYAGGMLIGGQAHSAGAAWEPSPLSLGGHDGTWATASWTLMEINATVEDTPLAVVELTGGVLDSGAGGNDLLIELREE